MWRKGPLILVILYGNWFSHFFIFFLLMTLFFLFSNGKTHTKVSQTDKKKRSAINQKKKCGKIIFLLYGCLNRKLSVGLVGHGNTVPKIVLHHTFSWDLVLSVLCIDSTKMCHGGRFPRPLNYSCNTLLWLGNTYWALLSVKPDSLCCLMIRKFNFHIDSFEFFN